MNKYKKTGNFLVDLWSAIFQKKNRKGWIEIVEAFVAILLVIGVLLIVINKNSGESSQDISERVYNSEITIVRAIQLNDSLRESVADAAGFPIEWNSTNFPVNVKNKIISLTPNYLACIAKICITTDPCYLSSYQKQVYAQSAIISGSGTKTSLNMTKINLFCWAK